MDIKVTFLSTLLLLVAACASVEGKDRRRKDGLFAFACAHQCTCYPNLYIITCQGTGLQKLPPELPTGDVMILNLRDNLFETLDINLRRWPQLRLIDLRGNLWLNCTWLAAQNWRVNVQSWCDFDSKGSGETIEVLPSPTVPNLPNRETIKFDDFDRSRDGSKFTDDPYNKDGNPGYPHYKEVDQLGPIQRPIDKPVDRFTKKPIQGAMKGKERQMEPPSQCPQCVKAGIIGAAIVLAFAVSVIFIARVTKSCIKRNKKGHRRRGNLIVRHTNGLSSRRSTEASLFEEDDDQVSIEREM